MQLTFLGATATVTGSRYLIEAEGKRILVDCGLFQGYKELRSRNWVEFPVSPKTIDAVILTHAHLDHSGYIPLLVKNGFRGYIYCTAPTFDLCKLLLPDSGYIQEEDARRANKYHYSKHTPALPLYGFTDAEESLSYFRSCPVGKDIAIGQDIHFRFERGGHILGAAWVLLKSEHRSILFSGDIGRPKDPVMKAPVFPLQADYVVVESTYGNRLHEKVDPLNQLADVITRAATRGGTVLIPSFAVGRAQELMYYIYMLKKSRRIVDIPVYLDSPMAINATGIMETYLNEHRLSADVCKAMAGSITYTHSIDASKALNNNYPKVIIAASGMATGGRVLHHLKNLASNHKNIILFAGFQAGGTRGDRLLKGEKEIKIHGDMIPVKAEIVALDNMSAHADYEEILHWLGHIHKPPLKTFITHGEETAALAMKNHIEERLEWPCVLPQYQETFVL